MEIKHKTTEFLNRFKNVDEIFLNGDVPIPKILYVANKAEDGFEGDVLGDFFSKFPGSADDLEMEPIFISSEHGDGFADLYAAIEKHIPPEKFK